jgi:hypothetical protein
MSKPNKPTAARKPSGTSQVAQLVDAHTASLLVTLKNDLVARDEKKRKAAEARKKRKANSKPEVAS